MAGKDGKAVRERLAIIEAEGDVEKSIQRNIPVVPRLSLIPVPAPIAEAPCEPIPQGPGQSPDGHPHPAEPIDPAGSPRRRPSRRVAPAPRR